VIDEKALDLGRTIGQSDEFKALRRAEQAMREDTTAQERVERIQQLMEQLELAAQTGEMPDQALAEQYREAIRDLQLSPTGQTYVVARTNFEKLMQKVNERISEGIEKGATSSIITL